MLKSVVADFADVGAVSTASISMTKIAATSAKSTRRAPLVQLDRSSSLTGLGLTESRVPFCAPEAKWSGVEGQRDGIPFGGVYPELAERLGINSSEPRYLKSKREGAFWIKES
jgi:hypothetical protein